LLADIAYAMGQSGAGQQAPQGSGLLGLMPLVIIFVIFYFLLIRPQQKKTKEHQEMVNNLKAGDQVITNGGLHGKLTRVDDNTVMVEVADKVRLKLTRQSIAAKKEDGSPAKKENNQSDKK